MARYLCARREWVQRRDFRLIFYEYCCLADEKVIMLNLFSVGSFTRMGSYDNAGGLIFSRIG